MDAEIIARLDAVLWWLKAIAGIQIGALVARPLAAIIIAGLERLWP